MRIRPLFLITVAALAAAQEVRASAAVDAAEAAYVDALKEAAKAGVAKKEADAALERERAAYQEQTAEVRARREAALRDLDGRVQQAEQALAALKRAPAPVVEAMAAYELELAAAQAALKPHLDAADAAQKTLVSARSRVSVAKAAIERAKARIGVANSGIADEEALIKRIEAGDQAVLDELAKKAIEEKETVAAILRDFAPAYMAAKSTARIAVGVHLPGMYKAKQAIEAVKTRFCDDYTQRAKLHIDNGVLGIEAFLRQSETAGVFIDLADRMLPKETDAVCHLHLAEIGIGDAATRIADARKRIADSEAEIFADEVRIRDAEKAVADAQAQIAEGERSAADARAALDAVKRKGDAARPTWEAELTAKTEERARAEAELVAQLDKARAERDAVAAPFDAELKGFPAPREDAVAAAYDAANRAELSIGQQKENFLHSLLQDEVRSGVSVRAAVKKRYGLDPEICVSFINQSRFAVANVWVHLAADGKPLPADVQEPLAFRGYNTDKHKAEVSRDYDHGALKFGTSNRYSETIPYLMPSASSAETCAPLFGLFKGENLRRLEAMGLGENTLSRFGLTLTRFEVADPAKETRSGGRITLGTVKLDDVYRSRLDRARTIASGAPVAPLAPVAPSAGKKSPTKKKPIAKSEPPVKANAPVYRPFSDQAFRERDAAKKAEERRR